MWNKFNAKRQESVSPVGQSCTSPALGPFKAGRSVAFKLNPSPTRRREVHLNSIGCNQQAGDHTFLITALGSQDVRPRKASVPHSY